MPIRYTCVGCRDELVLPDEKAGQLCACPRCRLKFLAPAAGKRGPARPAGPGSVAPRASQLPQQPPPPLYPADAPSTNVRLRPPGRPEPAGGGAGGLFGLEEGELEEQPSGLFGEAEPEVGELFGGFSEGDDGEEPPLELEEDEDAPAPRPAARPATSPAPRGRRPAAGPSRRPPGQPPAGTPPAGTPPAGTPPAGTPPAGTPPHPGYGQPYAPSPYPPPGYTPGYGYQVPPPGYPGYPPPGYPPPGYPPGYGYQGTPGAGYPQGTPPAGYPHYPPPGGPAPHPGEMAGLEELPLDPGGADAPLELVDSDQGLGAASAPGGAGSGPFRLVVLDGLPEGTEYDLPGGDIYLIGRDKQAHVKILSTSVSRRQARIDATGGQAVLIDLGSANGTQVNGESVDRHPLRNGDLIKMGSILFRFETG